VATVNEPAQLGLAFAAYHLGLGAQEVFIFLDTPDPEAEALLKDLPGCHVTVTDDAYWAANPDGHRVPRHITRQMRNAHKAYADGTVDWLTISTPTNTSAMVMF